MSEPTLTPSGAISDAVARTVVCISLLGVALIHVLESPDAFGATLYLGLLFVGAIVASLAIAAALTQSTDSRVWDAALALPAVILLCYVISRSIGLPSFTDDVGVWDEPLGLASMVAEGLAICVSSAVLVLRHQVARGPAGRRVAAVTVAIEQ